MDVQLYCLKCPLTGLIRYIGYTTMAIEKRLRFHVNSSTKGDRNTHRGKWITSLLSQGLKPVAECLVSFDCLEQAKRMEVFLIAHYKQFCNLVNGTPGGDGRVGHRASEETKKKMSLVRAGRPQKTKRTEITIVNTKDGHRIDFKDKWEAATYLNCHPASVLNTVHGNRKALKGYYCYNTKTYTS